MSSRKSLNTTLVVNRWRVTIGCLGEPNDMGHGECVGMMVDFVGLGLYDRIYSLNDYFMCEKI